MKLFLRFDRFQTVKWGPVPGSRGGRAWSPSRYPPRRSIGTTIYSRVNHNCKLGSLLSRVWSGIMRCSSFWWQITDGFFRSDTDKTERANVMVTSGALLFILVAATLVTATFLMSPVIEDAFGERARMRVTLVLFCLQEVRVFSLQLILVFSATKNTNMSTSLKNSSGIITTETF